MPENSTDKKIEKLLSEFDGDINLAIESIKSFDARKKTTRLSNIKYGPEIVNITNVTKTYKLGRKNVQALNDISLSIKEGEFVALTGPSGSGKSTLMQIIGGLDKPTDGKVIVDSKDISRMSDRQLSIFRNKTIGYVFQFFYLQPFLSTSVNLEVPGMFARTKRSERLSKIDELATAVSLSDRLSHLPKELSGGQMQRAAIARALLNKPKLLLADEPTGNLDRKNGMAIIDLFQEVREKYGATVIVVTHDKEIASRADREIKLMDGEIQK